MTRRVVITGLGPVSGLALGISATWEAVCAARSAIAPIQSFDASAYPCRIAAEVRDFKVAQFVPKSYRKATKVMCRDIELAVAAADLAARDAKLVTKGTADEGAAPSYPPSRMGAHIGAGLIAAEVNELTSALIEARNSSGGFDFHKWGQEGITHLTPLWLLKYLPNMLACHVTIIHDAQGPSNTITCAEASSGLSIGESFRVIQRGAADLCFCGGAESRTNPVVLMRQHLAGWLTTADNDQPASAIRPFCHSARGTIPGEGGAIVILEALDAFEKRAAQSSDPKPHAYAELLGFGASQTVHPESRNRRPDPQGRSIAAAIRAALRDAAITPDAIDLVIPFGVGVPEWDQAEAAALRTVFAQRLASIPVVSLKPMTANCGAGAGGLDACIAAMSLAKQTIPARLNCDKPLEGLNSATAPSSPAKLNHVLTYTTGLGGQNAALILRRLPS